MKKQPQEHDLDYVPEMLSVQDARDQTKELSSQILDMMEIEGKVTEPGPGISTCSADPKKSRLYTVHHPWAIYGVPDGVLEQGMQRLREGLPGKGWKILKDGRANSKDQDPVIHAENKEKRYALDIEWQQKTAQHEPQISVTLVSACLKTPEGESPSGQY